MFILWINWVKSGGPVTGTSDVSHQDPHLLPHYLVLPQSGDSTSVVISSGHGSLGAETFLALCSAHVQCKMTTCPQKAKTKC